MRSFLAIQIEFSLKSDCVVPSDISGKSEKPDSSARALCYEFLSKLDFGEGRKLELCAHLYNAECAVPPPRPPHATRAFFS